MIRPERSRPGRRVTPVVTAPAVLGGLGVNILTTSRNPPRAAQKAGVGARSLHRGDVMSTIERSHRDPEGVVKVDGAAVEVKGRRPDAQALPPGVTAVVEDASC